ncbi:MAG: desulfoferrodoxin [Dethiobacteria bacterium]|jgi:superoxide reductase|nr:desulfoferrodoxin [Bacillota bacterium]
MTALQEVYKCDLCGNIVDVLHAGKGELVCCNKPMVLLQENTFDASKEKHVPVIDIKDEQVVVRVGSAEHPMEEKHYIEWIELIVDGRVMRQFLAPDDRPEAKFVVDVSGSSVDARAYCNIHGLWSAKKEF